MLVFQGIYTYLGPHSMGVFNRMGSSLQRSASQVHFQRRGHQEAAARGKRQVPRDRVSAALDLDGFGWTWSCLLRMT